MRCYTFIYIFGLGIFFVPDIKLLPTILAEVSPYIFAPKPIWKCSNLEKLSAFFIY
nr:MAG TPA: hypothetical protein [Caudoviricetes sp.]